MEHGNDIHTLNLEELDIVTGGADGTQTKYTTGYGTVAEKLPNAMFRVNLDNGESITARMSGKLRMNYVRIEIGERVEVKAYNDGSGALITNVSRSNAF